ncbi:MAG TPA: hypothetical protein PLH39_08815, partial [Promineifilum sp.]|nr:hypothetical protein [Promineifilum sp.]
NDQVYCAGRPDGQRPTHGPNCTPTAAAWRYDITTDGLLFTNTNMSAIDGANQIAYSYDYAVIL